MRGHGPPCGGTAGKGPRPRRAARRRHTGAPVQSAAPPRTSSPSATAALIRRKTLCAPIADSARMFGRPWTCRAAYRSIILNAATRIR
jgi:hypothetical protein